MLRAFRFFLSNLRGPFPVCPGLLPGRQGAADPGEDMRETTNMERITSRQNPLVRQAAALLKGGGRRESGQFLCEGARLCRDAVLSGVKIDACFVTESAREKYGSYLQEIQAAAGKSYLIEDHVAGLLSDTKSPQGVFCVCEWPGNLTGGVIGFVPRRSCLVLENLQDPGNLGTVLRTAEALGISRVFLLGEHCDPLSPKVLRASMGAVFRLSLCLESSPRVLRETLFRYGYRLHAAVPDSTAIPVDRVDFSQGLHAVWIGNEGSGLSEEALACCDDRITIPMAGRAESLNASAAATILLWEMQRHAAGKGDEEHG